MKNWRTTAGGVLGGLGLLVAGLKILLAGGDMEKGAGICITGAAMIWTGIHSSDRQVVQTQINAVADAVAEKPL